MNLQEKAKTAILEFGGLDHFLKELEEITPLVPKDKLFHIEEMHLYWGMIFEIDLEMETVYIAHKDRAQSALEMFEDIYKHHGNLFAELMIKILSCGFNETDKIRRIN